MNLKLEENYFKDAKQIREDCYKLAWHMRGAVSLDQAMMMSYDDRNIISAMVKDHMEVVKKTGLPYF
jgi:hypothetical protein